MISGLLVGVLITEAVVIVAAVSGVLLQAAVEAAGRRTARTRSSRASAAIGASVRMGDPLPAVEAVGRLSRRERLRLLLDGARNLSGEHLDTLRRIAAALQVIVQADRRIRSRFWFRRLHAARVLTALGGDSSPVPVLLDDPNPFVRAQAAEWCAAHPDTERARLLIGLLDDESPLSPFTVQDALIRLGPLALPLLVEVLETQTTSNLSGALRVASALRDPRLLLPAVALTEHPQPAVRANATALIGSIGGSEATSALERLLNDPDAQVRAAAARAIGTAGHWHAVTKLQQSLRDPFWRVRREAGLALRALGAPGTLVLRAMSSDTDRFASDMARQILELPDSEASGT